MRCECGKTATIPLGVLTGQGLLSMIGNVALFSERRVVPLKSNSIQA